MAASLSFCDGLIDMDRTVVIIHHAFMHLGRSATRVTSLLMLKLVQCTVCDYVSATDLTVPNSQSKKES